MNKFSTIAVWSLVVGLVIVEVVIVFLTYTKNSCVSLQIDPLQIISMVIAIILTYIISRNIGKKDNFKKSQSLLLVDEFVNFRDSFSDDLMKLISCDEIEFSKAPSLLKKYRMQLQSIANLAISHNFLDEDDSSVQKIGESLHDILEILTNDSKIKNGVIMLTTLQRDPIYQNINDIRGDIFDVSVKINQKI